jgi:hypothetical protein
VLVGTGVSVGAKVGVQTGGRVEVGQGVTVGAGGSVGLGGGTRVEVGSGGEPPTPCASREPFTEAWIAEAIAGPALTGAFWIRPVRTALWWFR